MVFLVDTSRKWNSNVDPQWGVTAGLDNVIRQLELANRDLLPTLLQTATLVLISDYSGQHRGATHEAFSFLIADITRCTLWSERRASVRNKFLPNGRRMSYKGLNDGYRRRALMPFLSAADCIPGVLCTVLVDKKVTQDLNISDEQRNELPESLRRWPKHVLNKLMFVSHFGALFVAGVCSPGQDVLWLTDNDDFVINDARIVELTPFMAGMISAYCDVEMGHFRFGTTRCDCGDLMIEDLASLPDLASGALCDLPSQEMLPRSSRIRVPARGHISTKASVILAWLAQTTQPLHRISFVVDKGDTRDQVRVRALDVWTH